jgi:hypothetical protein
MGLYIPNDALGCSLRVTASVPGHRESARARISFVSADEVNEYDKNIQIADLNALNAIFAVMRWKKMRGFYLDYKPEGSCASTIGTNMLVNEDDNDTD